jgi:hypothetical protein
LTIDHDISSWWFGGSAVVANPLLDGFQVPVKIISAMPLPANQHGLSYAFPNRLAAVFPISKTHPLTEATSKLTALGILYIPPPQETTKPSILCYLP